METEVPSIKAEVKLAYIEESFHPSPHSLVQIAPAWLVSLMVVKMQMKTQDLTIKFGKSC